MERSQVIGKYIREFPGFGLPSIVKWQIVGFGDKRVIMRYLMTSGRSYCQRKLFDRLVKSGKIAIVSDIDGREEVKVC